MAERPYARIYYVDLQRDYPEVYENDAQLAVWLRLLVVAEAMWPAIPEIPRSAKASIVARLVAVELVIRVGDFGYRIKGMSAERNRRTEAARNAASIRWGNANGHADADADAYADSMPSRAKPKRNRAEQEDSPNPRRAGATMNPRTTRSPRAQGTSPRQMAKAALAEIEAATAERRRRVQQRQNAYYRGEITEAVLADMNKRDAPLSELPPRTPGETEDWFAGPEPSDATSLADVLRHVEPAAPHEDDAPIDGFPSASDS